MTSTRPPARHAGRGRATAPVLDGAERTTTVMHPPPDNVETSERLIVYVAGELAKHPDLELESHARHLPWGSEMDVSYGRRWWKIPLPRRRVKLLATHAGTVIAVTKRGRQIRL